MTAEVVRGGGRWTRNERLLLLALVLAYMPGTPGLGIETRSSESAVLGAVYGLAALAPLVALVASWKWPRAAARIALLAGAAAVVLPLLDLAGALVGPPPVGMVVVNVIIAVLGAAVAWRSWTSRRWT